VSLCKLFLITDLFTGQVLQALRPLRSQLEHWTAHCIPAKQALPLLYIGCKCDGIAKHKQNTPEIM
jgi:hypothetical protein